MNKVIDFFIIVQSKNNSNYKRGKTGNKNSKKKAFATDFDFKKMQYRMEKYDMAKKSCLN